MRQPEGGRHLSAGQAERERGTPLQGIAEGRLDELSGGLVLGAWELLLGGWRHPRGQQACSG